MEFAVHLREPEQMSVISGWSLHLASIYDQFENESSGWRINHLPCCKRIYIGDEFCSNRLPGVKDFVRFFRLAEGQDLQVTLLTPMMSNHGLDHCLALIDFIAAEQSATEIVVNDFGLLSLLREKYPQIKRAAGRLLNKGYKDPRLLDHEVFKDLSDETRSLLNESTFDHPFFQEMAQTLKVERLERDLLPYGETRMPESNGLKTAIYFPFGYITTGRICWTATFTQSRKAAFVPPGCCHRPCNVMAFKLNHKQLFRPVVQNGNTVFFLYRSEAITTLFNQKPAENLRLVYQGYII